MNEIRHRVGIRSSLQEVCEATYRPEQLQQWWAASARGTPAVGQLLELDFPGYPQHVWEISEILPDKRVRLRLTAGPDPWHGSELCFEFRQTESQVLLTLTHVTGSQTPDDAFLYFCTKWPMFLISLKQYLETGQGLPYPGDIKIQHN